MRLPGHNKIILKKKFVRACVCVSVTSELQNTKHSITLFRKMYVMKYSRFTTVIYCVIFVYCKTFKDHLFFVFV